MAQYNGYRIVPHNSYDQFRNATLGNGYNVDGYAGNQCWDYCALLWWQYGLYLKTRPGGGGAADCWLVSKNQNAVWPFKAVDGVRNIKRGDVIVTNRSRYSTTGHICIADEDFRTSGNTMRLRTVGQAPANHGIYGVVSVDDISIAYFLGIFRNTSWGDTPEPEPEPEMGYNKDRYNFVLFNRRKRQEKWIKKPSRIK